MGRFYLTGLAFVMSFHPAIGFAQTVPEPDAKRLALATEAITLGFPLDKRAEMFRGVMESIQTQMRQADFASIEDPAVQKIIDRTIIQFTAKIQPAIDIHIPKQFGAMARAYAREFTQEELQEIRDFAAKPAGQRFLVRSAALMGDPDVAAVNTEFFTQVRELLQSEMPKLTAELAAHLDTKKAK